MFSCVYFELLLFICSLNIEVYFIMLAMVVENLKDNSSYCINECEKSSV